MASQPIPLPKFTFDKCLDSINHIASGSNHASVLSRWTLLPMGPSENTALLSYRHLMERLSKHCRSGDEDHKDDTNKESLEFKTGKKKQLGFADGWRKLCEGIASESPLLHNGTANAQDNRQQLIRLYNDISKPLHAYIDRHSLETLIGRSEQDNRVFQHLKHLAKLSTEDEFKADARKHQEKERRHKKQKLSLAKDAALELYERHLRG
jgi:hypothetical protein